MGILDVLGAVLYELQPVRYSDAVTWTRGGVDLAISLGKEFIFGLKFVVEELHQGVKIVSWKGWLILMSWFGGLIWVGSTWAPLYVTISLAASIFIWGLDSSLSSSNGGSAYSIFNNFRAIPGTMTREDVDRAFRQGM